MPRPYSRNEAILMSIIDGTAYTEPPHSREEELLIRIKEIIESGGGGGLPLETIIKKVLEQTDKLYEPIIFEGTRAAWNALTREEKAKYTHAIFTDESKLYKYDAEHNTIRVVVGDLSDVYDMISPIEYDLIADKAYAKDSVFFLKKDGYNKFYQVTKDLNTGDTFVIGDPDPENDNIKLYSNNIIDAIEDARNVKSIPIEEIDEMFENL